MIDILVAIAQKNSSVVEEAKNATGLPAFQDKEMGNGGFGASHA